MSKYICPPGTVVIPVQNQAWLCAHFNEQNASITASKTGFLIALDKPEVQALINTRPAPEQLVKILWYIVGAYEAKTSTFLHNHGILCVWPQAVLEALAINYMANRGEGTYFIPVFGGDFNQHLVVHAAPLQHDFMLHAAIQAQPGSPEAAVRYMMYLLQRTKEAVEKGLQGGPPDEAVQVSEAPYQLRGRNAKWDCEAEEAADEAEEQQGDPAMDADTLMQAAENAYHRDLVELLRHPCMYRELGLSGPPNRIQHASLEERMSTMQVLQRRERRPAVSGSALELAGEGI